MDPEQRRFTPATAPAAVPMELEQPPMSLLPPELQGHIASFVCGTELAWNVRALSRSWEELTERLLRSSALLERPPPAPLAGDAPRASALPLARPHSPPARSSRTTRALYVPPLRSCRYRTRAQAPG